MWTAPPARLLAQESRYVHDCALFAQVLSAVADTLRNGSFARTQRREGRSIKFSGDLPGITVISMRR